MKDYCSTILSSSGVGENSSATSCEQGTGVADSKMPAAPGISRNSVFTEISSDVGENSNTVYGEQGTGAAGTFNDTRNGDFLHKSFLPESAIGISGLLSYMDKDPAIAVIAMNGISAISAIHDIKYIKAMVSVMYKRATIAIRQILSTMRGREIYA